MSTTVLRRGLAACLIAIAALGIGAGVAAADVPDRGNPRDNAVAACSGPDDNVLIDDNDPGGNTTCYQGLITTSCDATECVIITDDPRLSHRTNGSGGHTTAAQR
jgi:hypothetical protein